MWKETELSIVAQHITPKFSGLKYHQFIISHDSEGGPLNTVLSCFQLDWELVR